MINPLPLVAATLRRNPGTSIAFALLVAVAVAMGVAVTAQERALRQGSARAADRFDLVIAAPGSQTDILLRTVYLQRGSLPLLDPAVVARALVEPKAEIVAPIAFGDTVAGDPVIGTTAGFALHLSGGALASGRVFRAHEEAVVGAASPLAIGDTVHPAHGDHEAGEPAADDHDGHREHGVALTVVGRMAPTGSPWDRAVVVPVELTWELHNLPTGHPDGSEAIGPPYDPDRLPGLPALVVKPASLAAAYGLRSAYRGTASTAFFPAEVLVELYGVMGDLRGVLAAMALATQALVILAILVGVLVLLRLYRVQFAVLRALGAPRGYIFAAIWGYVTAIIAGGAVCGLALGLGATRILAGVVAARSGLALQASVQAPELLLTGAIICIGGLAALVPAALLYARPVVDGLR